MKPQVFAGARQINSALITGATGLIGFRLAQRLISDRVRVKALVRTGSPAEVLEEIGAEVVRGDLRDQESLGVAVEDVDTVYHCGAVTGPTSIAEQVYRDVNHQGTVNLLVACRSARRVERVVHVSTVAVVGHVPPGTVADEEAAADPVGPYGRTKLLAEQEARAAAGRGLHVVIARLMWTYGPGCRGAIKLFRMIAKRRFVLVGSGRNTIQPVWLEDAVDALLLCSTQPVRPGAIYNVAGPRALTTGELCRIIASATGGQIPPVHIPIAVASAAASICERMLSALGVACPIDHQKVNFFRTNHAYSIQRAAAELGWEPKVSFEEGSRRLADWMRERQFF